MPKSKKDKFSTKVGNIGFLLSILAVFILAITALIGLVYLLKVYPLQRESWAIFIASAIGAFFIVSNSKIPKFRVFIHEIKHAIVVVLTGNQLKGMKVDKHTGHVNYVMYMDKIHFGPLITLAPYYYPLFSLPVLIACIFLEGTNIYLLTALLGVSLACDKAFAYEELHPHQSDLTRVFGGKYVAGVFIGGINLLWFNLCLIWVTAKSTGYIIAFNPIVKRILSVIESSGFS